MRNKIYDYVFDDGKAVNLNLLLSCRQAYHEAGIHAFSTIALHVDFLNPPLDKVVSALKTIPQRYREVVTTVHSSVNTSGQALVELRLLHNIGIFPSQLIHQPNSRYLEIQVRDWFEDARNTAQDYNTTERPKWIEDAVVFGQFLENPRLQKWSLDSANTVGHGWICEATRENIGNQHTSTNVRRELPTRSLRLWAVELLKGIEIKIVEQLDEYNIAFLVTNAEDNGLAGHKEARIRLRFIQPEVSGNTNQD